MQQRTQKQQITYVKVDPYQKPPLDPDGLIVSPKVEGKYTHCQSNNESQIKFSDAGSMFEGYQRPNRVNDKLVEQKFEHPLVPPEQVHQRIFSPSMNTQEENAYLFYRIQGQSTAIEVDENGVPLPPKENKKVKEQKKKLTDRNGKELTWRDTKHLIKEKRPQFKEDLYDMTGNMLFRGPTKNQSIIKSQFAEEALYEKIVTKLDQ